MRILAAFITGLMMGGMFGIFAMCLFMAHKDDDNWKY